MSLRASALRVEWNHARRHRIVLISLIVMLFIPIMYGGFFLGSIWNPYGNTKNLPVAVVNEDEGATLDGKQLHIGNDLVANLRNNHDMGWRFVSATTAERGISDGTYYMRLVIPKNFSRSAATIRSTHPTKSTIEYTITPARNYIGSLLTTQAAKQITQTVSTQVSDAYVAAILGSIHTLSDGMTTASDGASQLANGSRDLLSGITAYMSGVGRLASGQASLHAGLQAIRAGSSSLTQGLTALSAGLPTTTELQQLTTGVTAISQGIAQLDYGVHTPDAGITQLQAQVANDAGLLQQKVTDYSALATTATSSVQALILAASSGQQTSTVATADITAALQLVNASQAVATQSATLLTHLGTLTTALQQQQTVLQSNVASLDAGMNSLAPNVLSAIGGYTAISNGTAALASGAGQLYSGSTSAVAGSEQLQSGTVSLAGSSVTLISGTKRLTDGSSTLAAAMNAVAAQLALQPTSSATKDQIVQPVTAQQTVRGDVPNYGFALSPYVLSLGLFVGALVFNVIYPVRRFFEKPKNAWSWWATKMSIASAVAIGQALVLDMIMVFGLGLRPDHPSQFVLVTVVTALTYMSIITLLAIALDNVGRFIAMVLLVLQLGSAGGVFPIVLSPGFFQAVNPFVPMTYSIYAYREAISSGLGLHLYWSSLCVLAAILVGANLVLLAFLHRHGMRHFKHESVDDSN